MHNLQKYFCNHNIVVSHFNYLLSYAFFRDIYFFCALSFGIFCGLTFVFLFENGR